MFVWLTKLFKFFVRTADADVERYLKLFTFMPISMVKSIMDEHQTQPSMRIAQRKLAVEVLELIHGEKVAREAEAQHRVIFNPPPISAAVEKKLQQPNTADINPLLNPNAPHISSANAPSPHLILPQSLIYGQPIARVLYAAGLVSSRSEGHRLVAKQGAYIGSRPGASGTMSDALEYSPAANWHPDDTERYIIDGDLLILRVGKWKVKIVKIVPDLEFRERALTAPGWDDDNDHDHDVTFSPQKREDRRRWDQDTQPWRRKEYFRRIVSP